MNPLIASGIFAVGIAGLFWLDRDRRERVSKALWLPVLWLAIGGSRNVGEWLAGGVRFDTGGSNAYLEGNPLDRNILAALMVLGLIVLWRRGPVTLASLRASGPIVAYVLYCLLSLAWSQYPFVGFRRWFRLVGDIIMVLVILTDADWTDAIKRVLKRTGFVLIPVSLLLIRYYPDLGRAYSPDGTLSWTGVAAGKNGLGIVCLIFGIASLWRFVTIFRTVGYPSRGRRLLAHGAVLALTLWLFKLANSMTSFSCFLLAAGLVIAVTKRRPAGDTSGTQPTGMLTRRSVVVHALVTLVLAAAISVLFFGASAQVLSTMGRDPTLTGRTNIWKVVLGFAENPLIGSGYETFWLGKRIVDISDRYTTMNQAHNGYIEVYLNLGWVGLALLAGVVATGYRKTARLLNRDPEIGSLKLAYLVIALIYNCTEGAFKFMTPVWFGFLLAVMTAPDSSSQSDARSKPSADDRLPEPLSRRDRRLDFRNWRRPDENRHARKAGAKITLCDPQLTLSDA